MRDLLGHLVYSFQLTWRLGILRGKLEGLIQLNTAFLP